jgi:hypothetical protein
MASPLASPGAPYPSVDEAKTLVCELCRAFYDLGWVSGTGGGMSMRAQGGRIVMAPSVRWQPARVGCVSHAKTFTR